MKHYKRFLIAMLLIAALVAVMLPIGFSAEEMGDLDYAMADEIFEGLYSALQSHKFPGDDAVRADLVDRYIQSAEGVRPGSVRRSGNALSWETTDGIACHFSPHLYELITGSHTASQELPTAASLPDTKAVTATGRDVYLFAPYYGLDDGFDGEGGVYDTWGGILAHYTGGSYFRYEREAATIDALADALEDSAVILIDSHGDTDTGDSNGLTSYLCLQNGEGITHADYAFDEAAGVNHAYYGGTALGGTISYYEVDGTAIANHMEKDAPNNLFWNGICFGMSSDGISKPLMERGVGVVYGYSQDVSFGGDQYWMEIAMDELTGTKPFHQAISAMKEVCGAWDYSRQICEYNDWAAYWINETAADAVANLDSFPVVVSHKDSYPADPDALQTVYSDWTLPRMELTLEFRLPDGVKSPTINAHVFYRGTLPTPTGMPRNQEHEYTFVGWSLDDLAPTTAMPAQVYYPGDKFSFGYYDDATSALSFGDHSAVLYGIYSYADNGSTWYTTQVPDGPYDPYDPAAMFLDVPYGTWYYDSVRFAVEQKLVNGYPDATFRPDNTLQRSEAVAILYRAAGSPEIQPEAVFADVTPDAWYGAAVTWAAKNGIVKGVAEDLFGPTQRVTRAQLAVFLYRYDGAQAEDTSALAAFPDADKVPNWAEKEMAWAVDQGLINGSRIRAVDYLQPMDEESRAKVVTILERYLTK